MNQSVSHPCTAPRRAARGAAAEGIFPSLAPSPLSPPHPHHGSAAHSKLPRPSSRARPPDGTWACSLRPRSRQGFRASPSAMGPLSQQPKPSLTVPPAEPAGVAPLLAHPQRSCRGLGHREGREIDGEEKQRTKSELTLHKFLNDFSKGHNVVTTCQEQHRNYFKVPHLFVK